MIFQATRIDKSHEKEVRLISYWGEKSSAKRARTDLKQQLLDNI